MVGAGLLTAVSPCPLAAQTAAVTAIAGWAPRPRRALLLSAVLVAGIVIVNVGLALAVAGSLAAAAALVAPLRQVVGVLLGPLLILGGMVLAELLPLPSPPPDARTASACRAGVGTLAGGLGLGLALGLSLCPTTSAILFGVVVPQAVAAGHPLLYPLAYGLGFALPLLAIAGLIVGGGFHLAGRLREPGGWLRRLGRGAGWGLIMLGIIVTWHGLR
jgi:cytochrome c biogenesis protein CcdA